MPLPGRTPPPLDSPFIWPQPVSDPYAWPMQPVPPGQFPGGPQRPMPPMGDGPFMDPIGRPLLPGGQRPMPPRIPTSTTTMPLGPPSGTMPPFDSPPNPEFPFGGWSPPNPEMRPPGQFQPWNPFWGIQPPKGGGLIGMPGMPFTPGAPGGAIGGPQRPMVPGLGLPGGGRPMPGGPMPSPQRPSPEETIGGPQRPGWPGVSGLPGPGSPGSGMTPGAGGASFSPPNPGAGYNPPPPAGPGPGGGQNPPVPPSGGPTPPPAGPTPNPGTGWIGGPIASPAPPAGGGPPELGGGGPTQPVPPEMGGGGGGQAPRPPEMGGGPVPQVSSFSDVPASDPFYAAIMALAGQGAMAGYGNGTFGLNDPITGAQAALVMSRLYPNVGTIPLAGTTPLTRGAFAQALANILPGSPAYSNQFFDVPYNAPYAQAVGELSGLGITAGTGGGNFNPMGTMTRGQFAQMMQNTRQHFANLQPPPAAPAQNNPFLPGFNAGQVGGGSGGGGNTGGVAQGTGGSGYTNPFLSQLAQMGNRGMNSASAGQRAANLTSNFMQSPFQPTSQSLAL